VTILADPSHPGEVLAELFLVPLRLNAGSLARRLGLPRTRIERLVKGESRLAGRHCASSLGVLGTTAEMWMNLQCEHDLAAARRAVDVSAYVPLEDAA
jgi:addiction module HigA family antidote